MSDEANSTLIGKWSQAAAERRCYGGLWDKDPDTLLKQNLKPGYCGYCDGATHQGTPTPSLALCPALARDVIVATGSSSGRHRCVPRQLG